MRVVVVVGALVVVVVGALVVVVVRALVVVGPGLVVVVRRLVVVVAGRVVAVVPLVVSVTEPTVVSRWRVVVGQLGGWALGSPGQCAWFTVTQVPQLPGLVSAGRLLLPAHT